MCSESERDVAIISMRGNTSPLIISVLIREDRGDLLRCVVLRSRHSPSALASDPSPAHDCGRLRRSWRRIFYVHTNAGTRHRCSIRPHIIDGSKVV